MVQPNLDRSDEDLPEPPQVRRLRLLVSLLMVVMIGGMVVVAVTMVMRLGMLDGAGEGASTVGAVDAQRFTLPAGAEVVAVGQAAAGVLFVTRDASGAEMLRVMDPASGAQISATPIVRE